MHSQATPDVSKPGAALPDARPEAIPHEEQDPRFLSNLLKAVEQAIISTDLKGRITYWNRHAELLYGWTAKEVAGSHVMEMLTVGGIREEATQIQACLQAGERWSGEYPVQRRDGESIWVRAYLSPIIDEAGEWVGILSVSHDITDRKRMEREREELLGRSAALLSETNAAKAAAEAVWKRFVEVLDSIDDGFYIVDRDWRFVYINPMAQSIFQKMGKNRTDLIGKCLWDEFPSMRDTLTDREFHRAVAEQVRVQFERNSESLGMWVDIRAYPSPESLCVFFSDISERKRYEQEIRWRVRQQAAVAELGQRALEGADLQRLMEEAVDRIVETLSIDHCSVLELMSGGDRLRLRAGVGWLEGRIGQFTLPVEPDTQAGYTLESREPVIVEDLRAEERFRVYSRLLELELRSGISVVIHGAEGPLGVVGAFTAEPRKFTRDDVNFLQSVANVLGAAMERVRSLEEFRRVTSQARCILWASDVREIDGGLKWDSVISDLKAAQAIFPLDEDDPKAYGLAWYDARHPDDRERVDWIGKEAILSGRTDYHQEYRCFNRYGAMQWLREEVSIQFLSPGHWNVVGVGFDITDRKRIEEALRDSEEQFRTLVEQSPLSIQILSPEGWMIQCNPAWENLWGVTQERAGAYNLLEDPQLIENGMMPYLEKGFRGEATEIPPILYDPNRTEPGISTLEAPRWVRATIYPIKDQEGRVQKVVLLHEDFTERQRLEEELALRESRLREQLELTRAIAENAAEAIFRMDEKGRITYLNPAAEKMFGWRQEELIGKSFHAFFHRGAAEEESDPLPVCVLMEVLTKGRTLQKHEDRFRRKEGGFLPVLCSNAPIFSGDRVTGAVLVAHDMTERKQLEEALRQRAETLVEADRRKNEFLTMLAHELRNPLGAASNAIRLLKETVSPEEPSVRIREILERQLNHLSRLVNDLLDVSGLSYRKFRLHKERIDLQSVLSHAVETVKPLIESHGHRLTVTVPSKTVMLDADAARLEQVVGNLLSNAAKYTPDEGCIALSAEVEDGNGSSWAVVRVRDNGMGISPELLPHVFDLFTQADRSLARTEGGLGIGLTVVKNLVEMHGGTVSVRSEGPGKGAEFVLRLPGASLKEEAPKVAGESPPLSPAVPLKVLVVEDNRDGAEMLAALLGHWGHEVRVAFHGQEGLVIAETFRPEVVLLDIGLPEMDGYEVARRLKDRPETANTSLVALTGYGDEASRIAGKAVGFDFHLIKPVDLESLQRLLAELKPPPESQYSP